ncbi:MAG TPA: TOMM system kinase/cyclase fusion protein, partial [Kofleriaceae bacterium]
MTDARHMDTHELRPGVVLQGRYQVVSALGFGGFGVVYKAIQLATGQPVAVKVMRAIGDEPPERRDTRVARFRREMELCARLQHPNIVGLIDSGQTDDGRLFAVFQFASGKTLDQVLLDEGPLHPREARHLMLQVLDALSCAHNIRVVHRDLKPANIMISSTGTRRNALVLDFGIGAIAHGLHSLQEAGSPKLTGQHEWVGTPYYAAPEQIRGYPPTAQSDIYSWGLVYLECLTGQPVITGNPIVALMLHVAPDAIPIPSSLRHHELGRILRQAVVKDVAERIATASSLLIELDNCDVSDLTRLVGQAPDRRAKAPGVLTAPTVSNDDPQPARGASQAPPTAILPEPPSSAHDRLVDAEQRQITAVCCALAPISALELDDLDALIQTQHDICTRVAQRFGGQLAGGLGHQVLIQFGFPTASEDDALRAARAALAVRAAVVERNAGAGVAQRMEIRIGIHTGLIAYGPHDSPRRVSSQVFSMTPMIASQLAGIAERDTIVASAATAQGLRAHLAMTRLGRHVIDGAGIELFRIEAGRAGARGQDTSDGEAMLSLVGREREIALLVERWGQVTSGTGETVLISGEAGIGKSRLTAELIRQVRAQPHVWLEARCTLETRNKVLHPILEVLEVALDLGETPADARLDRIEAAMIDFGFRPGEVVPLIAALMSVALSDRYPTVELSPARRRELTLEVIVSLLIELSERVPVVLFVEDLHWADPTTLELLGALVEAIPSSRVLAVFSARPEFTPPWRTSSTDQIQLSRLGRAQVEQMIRIVAGGKSLPEPVVEQLIARTDGVPLFVEELTRMVLESGALTAQGDRYELTGALSSLAIPTTLRGSLMARLDRLGRAKTTAQLAAALGREFDLALLRAVGSLDEAAVHEDLERLVEADLVHHKRRLRNPTWIFRHALIRDTAYESMPKRVQRKVHARIASVIEEQFAELVATRPDLLALHHAAADQKARAIGYAMQAARSALMASAYSHAIRHARDAIGWLEAVPDARRSDPDLSHRFDDLDRIAAELDLRVTLGVPLMMTQGFASREVEAN